MAAIPSSYEDPQPAAGYGASAPYATSRAGPAREIIEPLESLFGHKVVYIPGRGSYIDASTATDKVFFPYHGLHTLRTVQFIALGIIAALAAIAIAAIAITSGGIAVADGVLIGLVVGAGIAIAGSLAVHLCNTSDPLLAADKRKKLLKSATSAPGSNLLTDAEKARNFSHDTRLSPRQALTDFVALERLPDFKGAYDARKVVEELGRINQNLSQLEIELHNNLAAPRALRAEAEEREHDHYYRDTEGARTVQAVGGGALVAGSLLGQGFAGTALSVLGGGALAAGTVSTTQRATLRDRQMRVIDRQYAAIEAAIRVHMRYDERRADFLQAAGPCIITLQAIARTRVAALKNFLPL